MAISNAPTLAADGGTPVRTSPLPPWPWFDQEQVDAASLVLESGRINYWTGDEGRQFEQEWAAHTGAAHALALSNGTVSLEMIVRSLGIGPGDDVIVTPRTFIASVAPICPISSIVGTDNATVIAC